MIKYHPFIVAYVKHLPLFEDKPDAYKKIKELVIKSLHDSSEIMSLHWTTTAFACVGHFSHPQGDSISALCSKVFNYG